MFMIRPGSNGSGNMTRARLIEPVFRRRLTVLLAVGALWGCTMEEQGVQTPAVSPAGGGGAVTPADGAAASGGTSGSGEASGGASGNSGALASDAGTGSGGASASGGTSGGYAGSGSGGASTSGGTSGSNAGAGSGGASASNGTSGGYAGAGSGGASANGGTSGGYAGTGSGGASANGGTSGTETVAGSGGTSTSAGTSGTDAAGGTSASSGTSGTDAAAGSGGTSASGGTSRTDAAAGSGGTSASGGTSGRDAGSGSNDGTTSDGASGKDAGVDGPSWHLVWSDEFNLGANSGADTTKWNVATSEPYAVNGELQKYTTRPQNVFYDNQGHLVLRGLHDSWNSNGTVYPYTSGRLQTDGKFQFGFGHRLEVRAKLPAGRGSFPAILLMGTTGNWPQCGEVGLMEQWGQDKSWLYCSTYSGTSSDIKQQVTFPSATTLASDFHVYVLDWYSDHMVFFIDDVQVARSNFDTTSPFYTGTYYLILDVAVGGTMGGTIDDARGFPMDMVLDYVRVYSQ
jgi:beta-glucanase (GH16 family)